MQVLVPAALGDAPTAAIAVVAILLGLFFAVRGPREKRAAGVADGGETPGPAMVTLPVATAPEAEPGFVGPEGEVVGHGPIRLGVPGMFGGAQPPAPEPAAAEPVAPPPALPTPVPAPAPVAEAPLFTSAPPVLPDDSAAPFVPAAPAPAPEPSAPGPEPAPQAGEPAEPREPAWRVATRAANSAVHFRQGTIKIGGKPVDKRKDR